MRTLIAVVIWLALVGVAAAQDTGPPPAATPPPGSDPPVTWGAEVDFLSRYLWRGFPYSDGKVVWTSAWLSAFDFTAMLFANYDPAYDPELNEYDLSIAYERTFGRLTLTGTYVRYAYSEGDVSSATTELIGRAAYAVGPGEVFTTHAIDVDLYRGAYYVEVGYAIEHELDSKSSLAVDASLAFWSTFIEKYAGVSGKTVGPMSANLAFTRQIAPHFAVRPHVTLSRIPDAEVRRLLDSPAAAFGIAAVFDF